MLFRSFLLLGSAPQGGARPFNTPTQAVNVAVVFSGSAYQTEIKGRLSRENFLDLPLEVADWLIPFDFLFLVDFSLLLLVDSYILNLYL